MCLCQQVIVRRQKVCCESICLLQLVIVSLTASDDVSVPAHDVDVTCVLKVQQLRDKLAELEAIRIV